MNYKSLKNNTFSILPLLSSVVMWPWRLNPEEAICVPTTHRHTLFSNPHLGTTVVTKSDKAIKRFLHWSIIVFRRSVGSAERLSSSFWNSFEPSFDYSQVEIDKACPPRRDHRSWNLMHLTEKERRLSLIEQQYFITTCHVGSHRFRNYRHKLTDRWLRLSDARKYPWRNKSTKVRHPQRNFYHIRHTSSIVDADHQFQYLAIDEYQLLLLRVSIMAMTQQDY